MLQLFLSYHTQIGVVESLLGNIKFCSKIAKEAKSMFEFN